ncbi:MAG: FRG domain-containing protein [Acidobacteria bacterium]|nr:FRG domain-containing protein [Acidobacteriota bacterium]
MASKWKEIPLRDLQHALEVFAELKGKRWVCRGQSNKEWNLVPLIDRDKLAKLTRAEKLSLERQSINLFRSTVKFFAAAGEQNAMVDDVIALMVMRHYGVETRLLDWTGSPYVAAYFAACDDDRKDGVIWSFDEPLYEKNGKEQWRGGLRQQLTEAATTTSLPRD